MRADLVRCWGVNGPEGDRDPWGFQQNLWEVVEAELGLQGGLGTQRRDIVVYREGERQTRMCS